MSKNKLQLNKLSQLSNKIQSMENTLISFHRILYPWKQTIFRLRRNFMELCRDFFPFLFITLSLMQKKFKGRNNLGRVPFEAMRTRNNVWRNHYTG